METIGRSVERKRRARNAAKSSPLRGLSVFGMIGWSIAVPTVFGAFVGLWLEQVVPQRFSWPLALILAGVFVGSLIAWAWINKEGQAVDSQPPSAGGDSQ